MNLLTLLPYLPMLATDAATEPMTSATVVTRMVIIAGLALLPFAVMLLTSFTKMVVVLSLLRQAIGVQQAPPNQVINGMAILMSIYVMFPTGLQMYQESSSFIQNQPRTELFSSESALFIEKVASVAKEPLRKFLQKNTNKSHITTFYKLALSKFPQEYKKSLANSDFIVLIPAYITSQLKGAFEIGVLIYLPFFVIDLVTSNILLAMGMMMLSPLTIALPLKLLLLVMVDGWTLIIQGIVQTYK
ncbi:MAG: type III secretion system export apparatus subunit SctR [Chlamydiia bacterium]|jgi:type III secretion protein R|nr:EscR/YscR/HrcR family type III secretion system export apparatus protein [Chlamydiota bacterium]